MRTAYFILAIGITSCGIIPDGSDYENSAQFHARLAKTAREGAQADANAARSLAAQGEQSAAAEAQQSAGEFEQKADAESRQAAKDHWFGEWWPSFH